MIKVFLVGATGRMGSAVRDVAKESNTLKIIGGIGQGDKELYFTKTFPKNLPPIDVVIDFSSIEVFDQTITWCLKNKLPLVSGVTGLSVLQQKQIQKASKKIPILWAPNMSIGIALIKNMLQEMTIPESFDVHLLEYHHRYKKDAPSGTAKDLEIVLKQKSRNFSGTSSVRGGGIFGVHRVDLMAESEVITIQHQALDRHVFAKGAITAALWLVSQKEGLYSLQDVLSFDR